MITDGVDLEVVVNKTKSADARNFIQKLIL